MLRKNFLIVAIVFLILLTIGFASASQNLTNDSGLDEQSSSEEVPLVEEISNNGSSDI